MTHEQTPYGAQLGSWRYPELRSCLKVEVAIQGSPYLIVHSVCVDIKVTLNSYWATSYSTGQHIRELLEIHLGMDLYWTVSVVWCMWWPSVVWWVSCDVCWVLCDEHYVMSVVWWVMCAGYHVTSVVRSVIWWMSSVMWWVSCGECSVSCDECCVMGVVCWMSCEEWCGEFHAVSIECHVISSVKSRVMSQECHVRRVVWGVFSVIACCTATNVLIIHLYQIHAHVMTSI